MKLGNGPALQRCAWVVPRLAALLSLACAIVFAPGVRADVIVPAGGVMNLGGGALDLGCTDLIVAGTLSTGSGPITNVRNLVIEAGGVIDAAASVITIGGNWSNSGTFTAGTSQVNFTDICASSSTISGSTTFYSLSFVSNVGKVFSFAVGSTQTIQQQLTIAGTAANPLQFRSTVAGQVAFINLLAAQNIQHVGVTDVWATGVWLAPYLNNEGGGGNANRWFGIPDYARIPTMGTAGLFILLMLVGFLAARTLHARRRPVMNSKEIV